MLPDSKFQLPTSRRSRATILMLVVGVLALMAILGTAYIVSARTERGSARASTDVVQADMAAQAVLQQMRQVIYDEMPIPLSTITSANMPVGTTRYFDYPESQTPAGALGTATGGGPVAYADEPWLASSLYPNPGTDINPYSRITAAGFDPSLGTYTASGTTLVTPKTPAVGSYAVSATPVPDGYYNLLPFSSPSGVRYRYVVRVIDTNRMVNLNTGSPGVAGAYLTGFQLGRNTTPIFDSTGTGEATPVNLDSNATLGRVVSPATVITENDAMHLEQLPTTSTFRPFDLSDELELRSNGTQGQGYTARPAATGMWPNNLKPGTQATVLPLVNTVPGTPGTTMRHQYTTYSWDRDIRRYHDPDTTGLPYAINGTLVWSPVPAAPAPKLPSNSYKIPINVPLAGSAPTTQTLFPTFALDPTHPSTSLAGIATNIISALEYTTGSAAVARSFAANYIMARYSGGYVDLVGVTPVYHLPAGPSFVDDQGIHMRGATSAANKFQADPTASFAGTGVTYFGYSAQPFINEVAMIANTNGSGVTTIADYAIEIVNPYNVALDVSTWSIYESATPNTLGTVWTSLNINLGLTGQPGIIPANSIVVLYYGTTYNTLPVITNLASLGRATQIATALQPASTTFQLVRPYMPTAGGAGNLIVDTFTFSGLALNLGGKNGEESAQRSNSGALVGTFGGTGNFDDWGCALDTAANGPYANNDSLGASNPKSGTSRGELHDPFAVTTVTPPPPTPLTQFSTFADFTRIMKMSHTLTTPLTTALAGITTTTAPYNGMNQSYNFGNEPYDAQVHMDYRTPTTYFDSNYTNASGMDLGAVKFLDYVAWIDRVSDPNIDVGSGTLSVDKLRLPGRINMNTALPDVLASLPGISDQMAANIVAYRDALTTPFPYKNANSLGTTSSNLARTGTTHGFRSVTELLNAIGGTTPNTLEDFYANWTPIYSMLTVRSDTFVVYGYLEALRINNNPLYAGTHNAADWYGTVYPDDPVATLVADYSPTDSTHSILRLSRRRFIAIIDRSFCNYPRDPTTPDPNFTLPRVVAYKELPP